MVATVCFESKLKQLNNQGSSVGSGEITNEIILLLLCATIALKLYTLRNWSAENNIGHTSNI